MITTILPFLSFSITAGAKRSVFNVQECTPTQLRAETPIHTDTQKHTHLYARAHTHTLHRNYRAVHSPYMNELRSP
jgi:hypothetical protein